MPRKTRTEAMRKAANDEQQLREEKIQELEQELHEAWVMAPMAIRKAAAKDVMIRNK